LSAVSPGLDGGALALRIERIDKRFADCHAVRSVNLSVAAGQTVVLIGPSGCGKSTLLRLIAGLEQPDGDAGRIEIGGRAVAGKDGVIVPPEARRVGLVFQDFALFPHMNVADNVAFGLPRGADRAERITDALNFVRLGDLARRFPHELSGGQQQRVALARALAPRPAIVLFDEPFSNLDHTLRGELREETRELLKARGMAALFVTHDREEALSLADALAVMDNGVIIQTGTPREVYVRPATAMAGRLLGEINVLPAQITADGHSVDTALGRLRLDAPAVGATQVLLRPEAIDVNLEVSEGNATVEQTRYYGHDQLLTMRLSTGEPLLVRLPGEQPVLRGQRARLSVTQPVAAAR
jgi:iron(III) transport system ATP-binding protein